MSRDARPCVVVDPHFRTMVEIFDDESLARLVDLADVEWGVDEPMPTERLNEKIERVDAIVFGAWRHGMEGLHRAPRLRALLEVAGGHEHNVNYASVLARGIQVGSCAPAFARVVAEHSLALALSLLRGVSQADRAMRSSTESWLHEGNVGNRSLYGATVGFIGCGGVSRELHELLRAFDVNVVGYDPPLGSARLRARGIEPMALAPLMHVADVTFVLAAPTPATIGLVSRPLLDSLRPEQAVVVTNRASVVDFVALRELAGAGRFRVATDVFPSEPTPHDDPLRGLDNVITTPHLAGALPDALRDIGRRVVGDLELIFAGETPTHLQYLDSSNADGLVQA